MTSPIPLPARVIGLMSGTSADGVDAALIVTDGETVMETGPSLFVPYDEPLRRQILALMGGEGDKQAIAHALTEVHLEAVQQLQKKISQPAHAVGFHGQTIRHAPELGITEQIGDAAWLAQALGIPVVADFRTNDVMHGGQGAPLVPLYQQALAHDLPKPLMVVNIGGVANVTWIGEQEFRVRSSEFSGKNSELRTLNSDHSLLAFDCGPGNALIDDWVHRHTGARYDKDGALAARGTVNEALVAQWLGDPFFAAPVPKSLDRNQFQGVIPALLRDLSQQLGALPQGDPGIRRDDALVADGAATLTAFTAAAIARAVALVPERPKQLLITGGGRHNPTLMQMLAQRLNPPPAGGGIEILPVESVGWDGDMLEAQAFAYLAVRSIRRLPLSLPSTTGVNQPVTGGVFHSV